MKLIQNYGIIKGRITEKTGEIMASRTEAGSSSSLHLALSQGLKEGKVSQIEINGKIYLVFKVEGGQLADNPISPDVDLEKVKSVAKLVLDTHKAAAPPSLRDKEITHITDVGVRFGADDVRKHKDIKLEDHKPYLTTTEDLDWQQGVIHLEQHLDGLEDDDVEMDVADLTPDFKAYLKRNDLTDEKYPAYKINQCLLDYTCEKIRNTQRVDVQVGESKSDGSIRKWVDSYGSAEVLINASNQTIQQYFTAQHVWQTFTNLFDPQPRIHHPLTPYDDEDTPSTTSSSSSNTSVSESEEDSDDDTHVPDSEHEERGRPRTRRESHSRSRSNSPLDEPSFPSRSPSPSRSRSRSRSRGSHIVEKPGSNTASDRPRIDRHRTWEASTKGSVVSFPGSYQGKPSSIKGEAKRYLGPKESRLTRTYRGLLEAIQRPIGETARGYKGASAKLEAFIASPDAELEQFTDGELLAFRDEYNKAMRREDFARHADKQDAVAFEALIRQLKQHQ